MIITTHKSVTVIISPNRLQINPPFVHRLTALH